MHDDCIDMIHGILDVRPGIQIYIWKQSSLKERDHTGIYISTQHIEVYRDLSQYWHERLGVPTTQ